MLRRTVVASILSLLALVAGARAAETITKEPFGKTASGEAVDIYTLNRGNVKVKIITYGALVTSIEVPDRTGKVSNVALGFDTLDKYLAGHPFFGATVGRYANRIANAKFTLDGKEYKLAANNGANSLHGGTKGFDKVVWKAEHDALPCRTEVRFTHVSPDGDEGYPGTLSVTVTYALYDDGELMIHYSAKTDKATPINLTHHSYFNLAGAASGKSILDHELTMPAGRFLPVSDALIPTGELKDVTGTPMDFRAPHKIGERIAQVPGAAPGGYDHYWILDRKGDKLTLAATLYDPSTGRAMDLLTTEPGLQFYTGNFLDGTVTGSGGTAYQKNFGLCLEPTHYPDSPNQPAFPSTILKPGKTYQQTQVMKFYVK